MMPKVSIYAGGEHPGEPQRTRCEIGWAKGYDVQIAVTQLGKEFEPTAELVTRSPGNTTITVAGGMQINGTATSSFSGPVEPAWQGPHMTLTRAQINNLIKTLREARDAAYGRDE